MNKEFKAWAVGVISLCFLGCSAGFDSQLASSGQLELSSKARRRPPPPSEPQPEPQPIPEQQPPIPPAGSAPYKGVPAPIPGTVQAEDFDQGGEGYHLTYANTAVTNPSAPYRTSAVSLRDQGEGYEVYNLATGSSLTYTVNVVSAGIYTFKARVVSMFSDSALHVEVDGVRVTGSLSIPASDSWSSYVDVSQGGIALTAGQHQVKIIVDMQWFGLNHFSFMQGVQNAPEAPVPTPTPPPASAPSTTRVFSSGFEGLSLGAPYGCGTSCWQDFQGTDSVTGYSFQNFNLWGDVITNHLQVLVDAPTTPASSAQTISNQLRQVTGPFGNTTTALYTEIKQRLGGATQDPFMLFPKSDNQGDLYISYYIKLPADLPQKLGPSGWFAFFAFKTGGDYRVESYIYTDSTGRPYWYVHGDNNANGGLPYQEFWEQSNKTLPVPLGQWFKYEVFWHRASDGSGRFWQAVNGQKITDYRGPLMGIYGLPIDRIMVTLNYGGETFPIYTYMDELEIHSTFPAGAAPH